MRHWKRIAASAVALVALYALLALALWFVMRRPPDQFGQVMKYVPGPMMMVLPFRPLWLQARAGSVQVGDIAPDFNLESLDRQQRVRLGAERGRPVVLIFGSYT